MRRGDIFQYRWIHSPRGIPFYTYVAGDPPSGSHTPPILRSGSSITRGKCASRFLRQESTMILGGVPGERTANCAKQIAQCGFDPSAGYARWWQWRSPSTFGGRLSWRRVAPSEHLPSRRDTRGFGGRKSTGLSDEERPSALPVKHLLITLRFRFEHCPGAKKGSHSGGVSLRRVA